MCHPGAAHVSDGRHKPPKGDLPHRDVHWLSSLATYMYMHLVLDFAVLGTVEKAASPNYIKRQLVSAPTFKGD